MNLKRLLEGKAAVYAALLLLAAAGVLAFCQGSETGTAMSKDERRIAEVLSAMAGAGKVEVALFCAPAAERRVMAGTETGAPTGAVIVAQGAEDLGVRLNLIRAVRTLLNLPEAAVDVFVMEDGR